jgi:hypothetical protein
MHVNGVIWGAFSTLFIGLCYYVVPRLTGVRVWGERWRFLMTDQASPRAAALRVALVSDRRVRLDRRKSDIAHARPLSHSGWGVGGAVDMLAVLILVGCYLGAQDRAIG